MHTSYFLFFRIELIEEKIKELDELLDEFQSDTPLSPEEFKKKSARKEQLLKDVKKGPAIKRRKIQQNTPDILGIFAER